MYPRLVFWREERRQRRRGRRRMDCPEDHSHAMAVATVAFWLGWIVHAILGGAS